MLGVESLDEVDQVHLASERPLVYGSGRYIRFLLKALPNVRFVCPVIREGTAIIAAIPLVIQEAQDGRTVVNSLPFFGSHGGPCWIDGAQDSAELQAQLLRASNSVADQCGAISMTVVENPFQLLDESVAYQQGFVVVDDRIGQVTSLPDSSTDVEASLFALYHVKTRNAVRKGQKLNQTFDRRTDQIAIDWVQAVHEKSIREMGGVPKSRSTFDHLLSEFSMGSHARLYIGSCDDRMTSGLLILMFDDVIEYFTPVVDAAYKDQQALSALIHHAMIESSRDGYRLWNWGGTWRSQSGVHRFKHRFGARDLPYRYFHRVLDKSSIEEPPSTFRELFPHSYVFKYPS
jgi:hypothetical protein